ncbi:3-phosphoshikimate 1-carboxyvinyltransferase [Bacillota bacterium]
MNNEIIIGKECRPKGLISLPPSKSLLHRAMICAALAGPDAYIENTRPQNDDVAATISCLKRMGLKFREDGSGIAIEEGIEAFFKSGSVNLQDDSQTDDPEEVSSFHCGESGSTLRFIMPLILLSGRPAAISGEGRLMQRPLGEFIEALEKAGGRLSVENNRLKLQGPIRPGIYELAGNISSQFISGLLMALPLLDGDSEIHLTTELESKPYVDMTIAVMGHFGVKVEEMGGRGYRILGKQKYKPARYSVEGDFSAAAYFLVAGALGCDVKCAGLRADSLQGDKEIINFISRCGGNIIKGEGGTIMAAGPASPGPSSAVSSASTTVLKGIVADISQCPDLAPPLAVLLSFCKGESRIAGAGRLRMKESDRLKSITEALKALGADITEGENFLAIKGVDEFNGGTVDPHKDHRIAMAGALAAIKCRNPVRILDPGCVKKSYPDFFKDFCGKERK